MNLSVRHTELAEMMDDASCDPVRLRRTINRFAAVNRIVSGWDAIYHSRLRSLLRRLERPVRTLDIGCGGGDILRRLERLARRDGVATEALGIDPDPRAIAVANRTRTSNNISYRVAHSSALVRAGERFDIVISNHLLHHLDASQFRSVISDCERLTMLACLHSDIARSRVAYATYSLASLPLSPGSFLRVDGLRSIRRSSAP